VLSRINPPGRRHLNDFVINELDALAGAAGAAVRIQCQAVTAWEQLRARSCGTCHRDLSGEG
jgi:hypothetical protein